VEAPRKTQQRERSRREEGDIVSEKRRRRRRRKRRKGQPKPLEEQQKFKGIDRRGYHRKGVGSLHFSATRRKYFFMDSINRFW